MAIAPASRSTTPRASTLRGPVLRSRHATGMPAPRPPWRWALLGALLGVVAATVVYAPAGWAAAAVARASGGMLQLQAPRGTLWNGSGQLVLSGGAGSRDATALPTRLSWTLRPAAGGLRLALASPCCTRDPLQLLLTPSLAGWSATVADGTPSQWPAALLSGLGTPWNTLQLEGDLRLETRGLRLRAAREGLQVQGRAQIDALQLASRLATVRPMGSYRLTLEGGETPTLQLATLEGPLRLTGSGQWSGSNLRFSGEASADAGREDALGNLLNIIGRRAGARSLITIG